MVDALPNAPAPGAVLADRYELVRLLGRGGMADVFEGRDRLLGRSVAVKVYRGATAVDRSRFDAEVLLLAGLSHAGLVSVYDAGQTNGDGFVVLELVEGPSLRATLAARGALPPAEVAALGTAVADALAYVHTRGIVHRDVTPSNILCRPDGTPQLTDFGIARLLDTTRVTATATTVGTAAYMAPEQVEGRDVTPAADVYALGLVLLEALTGQPAFAGQAAHEVAIARLVRDPDLSRPSVTPAWRSLLAAMTARAPEERPSAADVAARLEHLSVAGPPVAPVVVGSAAAVDPGQATEAIEVPRGGTSVMPAAMLPAEPTTAAGGPPAWWRRPGWWLAVAAAVLVLFFAAQQAGGPDLADEITESTTTIAPTTTAPTTTTTAPPDEEEEGDGEEREGRGNGGKGKGRGDD